MTRFICLFALFATISGSSLNAIEIINATGRNICLSNFKFIDGSTSIESVYLSTFKNNTFRENNIIELTVHVQLIPGSSEMEYWNLTNLDKDSRVNLFIENSQLFAEILPPAYEEPTFDDMNEKPKRRRRVRCIIS